MIYLIESAGFDRRGKLIKLLGIMVGEENQFSPILEFYNPTSKIIKKSNSISKDDFMKAFNNCKFKDNWFFYNQDMINYFSGDSSNIDFYISYCQVSYKEITSIVDKRIAHLLIGIDFLARNLMDPKSNYIYDGTSRELKVEYPIARYCYGKDSAVDLILKRAFSKEELEYLPGIGSVTFGIDSENNSYLLIVNSIEFTETFIIIKSQYTYCITDNSINITESEFKLVYIRPATKEEIELYENI